MKKITRLRIAYWISLVIGASVVNYLASGNDWRTGLMIIGALVFVMFAGYFDRMIDEEKENLNR